MQIGPWRLALLAPLALFTALAGCGVNEEDAADLGAVWVQTGIAGADLDGNGRTDIVTIASQQDAGDLRGFLKIYRQSPTGTFTSTQLQVGRYPWRLQVDDVNGDGAPDLLVLDAVSTSGVADDVLYLLLQDAGTRGQFLAPRAIASGMAAHDFTTVDINLDLARDVVIAGVAGGGTGATQLLQNPALRGFYLTPSVLPVAGRLQQLATGDYRGSGRDDLVSYAVLDTSAGANAPGQLVVNTASVVSGVTGSGFFETPGEVLAAHTGVNAQLLAVTDVDADGRADVVACFTPISTAFLPKISVVLQRAVGAPEIVDTSLEGLRGLDSFVVADLNDNGVPDVAATGSYPVGSPSTVRSTTHLLAPTAGGRYLLVAAIDMPVPMSRINAADVDGDGLLDLLLLGDRNRAFVMFQSASARGTFLAPRQL